MELISRIIGSRRAFFSRPKKEEMMTEVTKEFIQKNEDEKIIEIEIERLRSFKNHPFQVKDDN